MDTTEKGWQENREDYLKKAYAAVRTEEEPVQLNQAVDNWDMLTQGASKHYFWRALGNFRINDALEIVENGKDNLLEVDPDVSMKDLMEDVEMEPGEKTRVNISEKDDYRNFEDLEVPNVPLFIPWEHSDRHGYEIFPHESGNGLRGITAKQPTTKGGNETWIAFYNNDETLEGSTGVTQVLRGLQTVEGDEVMSTDDIFTDRNREGYAETIWQKELLKIRQRSVDVWNAAVEVVEDELPRRVEEYEGRWDNEKDEFEALKREYRLMAGDKNYDEENPTYIEQIVEDYYKGDLERKSKILDPYLERIESTPTQEGDMRYGEAVRGSETSEGKKQRNQVYMSHFLDLVWQMAEEKYED